MSSLDNSTAIFSSIQSSLQSFTVDFQKRVAALVNVDELQPIHFAIPIALILLRVAYTQAKRLFGSSRTSKPKGMSYVVKWGRERLYFPLPSPDTKLAEIRRELSEYTQLPPDSFKLVHAGAVMKDDHAPISSYGIKENSKIAIIGGGDNALNEPSKARKIPTHSATPQRRTEESTITQIRTEVDKVRRTLLPDVDTFLSSLSSSGPSSATPSQPTSKPKEVKSDGRPQMSETDQEHARLGELLLQSLLRLDAINAEGEWEEARKERKGAVREVQALLDRLDGGWKAHAR
ncbi:hypothetical protein C8Q75DRAFT_760479 [Abortiporus biennis]|nr:hypothetical protein C8Q75DRAFT_760479 [Abortiporus biennis]